MADPNKGTKVLPAHAPLLQLAYGALNTQVLFIAAQLGLADRLANEGPITATNLGSELGVDASCIERVLRALVSMSICDELEGDRFQLTPLGQFLRPSHPDSVEARVLIFGQIFYRLWGELFQSIQTGEGAAKRILGMPLYEYLAKEPKVGSLFDRTMASAVLQRLRPAVEAYDFGQFRTVVDIGGGSGALMVEILRAYPQPTGIVFDLPRTEAAAQRTLHESGVGDRCRFVAGNAFEGVPNGADAYILSNFLVARGEDEAVILLRNCREAVRENGRVLIIEWVMPAGSESREDPWFWDTVAVDLNMLAVYGSAGGRVRTRSGFRELLSAAGLEMSTVIPTQGSVSVIEARPVLELRMRGTPATADTRAAGSA
jgi:SAM-dependent methyltransferase